MAWKFGIQDKVILHGRVSREAALSAIAGAGIAAVVTSVSTDAPAEERGVITGKIFEAIGLRTPLLVVAPAGSDVEGILETAGLGRRSAADQTAGMAAYLRTSCRGTLPRPGTRRPSSGPTSPPRMDRALRAALRTRPERSQARPGGREPSGHLLQVPDEQCRFAAPGLLVGSAQDRGGVNGGGHGGSQRRGKKLTPAFVTRNPRPQQGLGRRRPEAHDDLEGRRHAISASSHGRQAAISTELGFWWIRFLPRGTHLKCLTTFVT